MKQINLYEYDELPTEEAREKARQWWIEAEAEDPAWIEEHFNSMRAIVKRVKAITTKEDFKQLLKDSKECSLTGYCADALYWAHYKDNVITPLPTEIIEMYGEEWEKEFEDRIDDTNPESRDYIEDAIRINDYDFLPDGTRWSP